MTPRSANIPVATTADENSLAVSESPGGLWSDVRRRFRRNAIALVGFYVVCFLTCVALFADFLANDKPYYLEYHGKVYFPILRSYLVGMRLANWPTELLNVNFKKLEGAKGIFPPNPYHHSTINYFTNQPNPAAPNRNNLLGTDDRGRDTAAKLPSIERRVLRSRSQICSLHAHPKIGNELPQKPRGGDRPDRGQVKKPA